MAQYYEVSNYRTIGSCSLVGLRDNRNQLEKEEVLWYLMARNQPKTTKNFTLERIPSYLHSFSWEKIPLCTPLHTTSLFFGK